MSEQLLREILSEVKGLKQQADHTNEEIKGLKQEIIGVKEDVKHLNQRMNKLEIDLAGLKYDMTELKSDVLELKTTTNDLKITQDMIFNEVGGLMEFRTETNYRFRTITKNTEDLIHRVNFLYNKQSDNEMEIFVLKEKLLPAK